jgi:uncharacterized membrane protein
MTMSLLLASAFVVLVGSMFAYRLLFREGRRYDQGFRAFQLFLGLAIILIHGCLTFGPWNTCAFLLIATVIGSFAEILGVTKGWVFGKYRYTPMAGPKLFGLLPAFAPLMWGVLAYLAFWMTGMLMQGFYKEGIHDKTVFLFSASWMVLLVDIVAEPIAVNEGRWVWEKKGKYYGIPFSNFIGWFATAVTIFLLFFLLGKPVRNPSLSKWIVYLPAFGYCVFLAICARVCFERKLKLAGWIGVCFSIVFLVFGMLGWIARAIP